ncbi:MAG: hypothetical protein V1725_06955 [archaeon]
MKSFYIALALVGALLALAAILPTPSVASTECCGGGIRGPVTVTGEGFEENIVTINAGEDMGWVNEDTSVHVISSYQIFDSGSLATYQEHEYTFDEAGTYIIKSDDNYEMTLIVV